MKISIRVLCTQYFVLHQYLRLHFYFCCFYSILLVVLCPFLNPIDPLLFHMFSVPKFLKSDKETEHNGLVLFLSNILLTILSNSAIVLLFDPLKTNAFSYTSLDFYCYSIHDNIE